MRVRRLEFEQFLPRPPDEVFAFFSDAHNLDRITPPWLQFHILTPAPIEMRCGTLLEYRLQLYRLPVSWQTEITAWEPPRRFVDSQRRGPYRRWVHEHLFEQRGDGTWMRDRVDYAVPGGLLEPLVHRWFVGPNLQAIFAYRREQLENIYSGACEG